jgi:hypothetical protein
MTTIIYFSGVRCWRWPFRTFRVAIQRWLFLRPYIFLKTIKLSIGIEVLVVISASITVLGSEPALFHSVTVSNDVIIATLGDPPPYWLVDSGAEHPHKAQPRESFVLTNGASILILERHSNNRVTAQLVPKPGVKIDNEFDGRSFGRGLTKTNYFIDAK